MSQDITVNPFLQSFWGVNQLYTTGGSRDMENQAILSLRGPKKQEIVFSLKKSMEAHFNRSKIFLLHFYDACDVNLWKKNFGRSTAYSWRTNDFIKFHHLMKKKKDNVSKTFGYLGYPAPIQFSASWTSSYLKSTHYDHVYITFNGLQVI